MADFPTLSTRLIRVHASFTGQVIISSLDGHSRVLVQEWGDTGFMGNQASMRCSSVLHTSVNGLARSRIWRALHKGAITIPHRQRAGLQGPSKSILANGPSPP